MNILKVALLQILPGNSWKENMEIGIEACRKAKASGADIALFPEMWSNGYHVWAEADKLRADAVPADSKRWSSVSNTT